MHDEDSHYGLNVENETWRPLALLRRQSSTLIQRIKRNRQLCEEAVKVSIQEIYQAYQTKNGAPVYGALKLIPDLTKARDGELIRITSVVPLRR